MRGIERWVLVAACVAAFTAPLPARAQDVAAQSAPDELPEGMSSGRAILGRPRDPTPEEVRRERERRYDASEPMRPLAFQLFLGGTSPLDSSLDQALVAHRYGDSPLLFGGDAALLTRVAPWLYLGGRVGARGRGWAHDENSPAVAGGVDLLAVAHARAYVGRIIDIGAVLGAGLGWGSVAIQRAGAWAFAPRLSGHLQIGFRLAPGARFGVRAGWDWFSLDDLDRYGSDLELGGPSLALGFEVRR